MIWLIELQIESLALEGQTYKDGKKLVSSPDFCFLEPLDAFLTLPSLMSKSGSFSF